MPLRLALPLTLLAVAAGPAWAQAPVMASYRAVYDLTLAEGSGVRGVETARGRIALEFTGNACEGYALNFRQVTDLSGGDIGRKVSDMRSTTFEDGDFKTFRFKTETREGPKQGEVTDGVAERGADKIVITLKKPKPAKLSFEGDAAFPTQHLKELVETARAGTRTYARRVYDGSDDSKDAYDTFAVIGAERKGGDALEQDVVKAGWDKMARWPVSISFFEPGKSDTPAYVISYELFDNGFGRALKLDYGSFAFDGKLAKLDVIDAKPCAK